MATEEATEQINTVEEEKIEIEIDDVLTKVHVKLFVTEDQKNKIENYWGNQMIIVEEMNKMIQKLQTPGVDVIEVTGATMLNIKPYQGIQIISYVYFPRINFSVS